MRFARTLLAAASCASFAIAPALAAQNGDLRVNPRVATVKTTPMRSAVAHRIAAYPQLAARVQPLLPPGVTLDAAATGFRNHGQFIAALHVSHNLGIPFAQLKAAMMGRDRPSLCAAIQELRPRVNAKAEASRAEGEALGDLTSIAASR